MADEDPDETSPWTRDDWVPDSAVPDDAVFAGAPKGAAAPGPSDGAGRHDEPPPEDFDDVIDSRSSRSSLGRKLVAAAIVAALLIGSAGALLRDDGDPEGAPTTTQAADRAPPGTLSAGRSPTTTDAASNTIAPTTVLTVTIPPPDGSGDAVVVADPIPAPAPAAVVVGEPPAWAERVITVPENLAAMAPTEVVTLTQSGIVNVTEFPSGRTRSLDVSGLGAQAQLSVGDQTIVVFNSTTMLLVRDGEPVVESSLSDGVIFVQPWTGTGNFVVTTPATGPETPERSRVLRQDGTLEPLESPFVDEVSFFSRTFSPDGDALVSGPGGVYAIGPDGAALRISSGILLAAGQRHWAVEECDETLRCTYSVVEWGTGRVTPGVLDRIDMFGFIDPATHISPDGRSIVFRGDTDGSGRRAILDVATGTTVEAGRINNLVYPDSWAADSSGVFVTDRFLEFVDRETGVITEIDDLDRMRTVATRPIATRTASS